MKKQILSRILSILLCVAFLVTLCPIEASAKGNPEPYTDCYFDNQDLTGYNFASDLDLIMTYSYSEKLTKWPAKSKLPKGFDPKSFLEWGKDPGLGVKQLHEMGLTGVGTAVAYVDQPLGEEITHDELKDIDLHYNSDLDEENFKKETMHGYAVLSLLAGKEIGVAPDTTVYYVANPSWKADQSYHAEAIRKLLETNRSLPAKNRFKVIAFSDNPDPQEKNLSDFNKAIKEAEKEGVYVLFCGEFSQISAEPYSDRNDPASYTYNYAGGGEVCFPVDRTTAYPGYDYVKWNGVSLSWTTPYALGLLAIGWQINPDLSTEELLTIMKETATKTKAVTTGGLVNPIAYAKAVQDTVTAGKYSLFLYNSSKVTKEDWDAIQKYAEANSIAQKIQFLDVKGFSGASDIYKKVLEIRSKNKGTLNGIQIFGIDADVPAFDFHYKVQMENEIDDAGMIKTDYFYGTADNDPKTIEKVNVCDAFAKGQKVDWVQDWPVVRLLLTKGDYAAYFAKVEKYENQLRKADDQILLAAFSNPIFAQEEHSDDMGWFIQHRMKDEFEVLNAKQYVLYGNRDGQYPADVLGVDNFTTETLKKQNKKGIADILISSHGQDNNIDKAYFENDKEKRKSVLNSDNINTVLGSNYYNLLTWTCNNAYGLSDNNLSYTALKGKAVNVFACTTIISNNGVDNKASLDDMKNSNFYYFYYSYMKAYYGAKKSKAESFLIAKQDYVKALLDHSKKPGYGGNYQFNLYNAIAYEHMGLLYVYEPGRNEGAADEAEKNTKVVTTQKQLTAALKKGHETIRIESAKDATFKIKKGTYKSNIVVRPKEGASLELSIAKGTKFDGAITVERGGEVFLTSAAKAQIIGKGKSSIRLEKGAEGTTITKKMPDVAVKNHTKKTITLVDADGKKSKLPAAKTLTNVNVYMLEHSPTNIYSSKELAGITSCKVDGKEIPVIKVQSMLGDGGEVFTYFVLDEALSLGKHTITFEADGYLPYTTEVTCTAEDTFFKSEGFIENGAVFFITMRKDAADKSLTFTLDGKKVSPVMSGVSGDGVFFAQFDVSKLKKGNHTLKIAVKGGETITRTFEK